MAFYIITYGGCQIEEIYAGETELTVVQAARGLINKWPEYRYMEDEEIAELAKANRTEFDLRPIPEEFTGNYSREELIRIYEHYCTGIIPRPPR